jgi:hypothetical protein
MALAADKPAAAPAAAAPAAKPAAAPAMAPGAKAAPAAAAEAKGEDYPAMMRNLVPLPTKFSELMTSVAANMDAQAAALATSKDKACKAEAASMKKLAKDHQTVAAQMKKIAADMEAAGKLTPGVHDMSKPDPKMGEMMMKQTALEREMAAMMVKNADETDKMLKEMAKGAPAAK